MNSAKIIQKEIKRKHLKLILDTKIDFYAGQFIVVYDNKNNSAIYTVAQRNKNENLELFITNIFHGEVGSYLASLNIGDTINFDGPQGVSKLMKIKKDKLFFIALGSGISSYRTLINNLENKKEITLIYSNRYEDDFFYDNEFKKMNSIKYIPIISSKLNNRDELIKLIIKNLPKDKENYQFFISGSMQAATDIQAHLLENNIKKEQIIIN